MLQIIKELGCRRIARDPWDHFILQQKVGEKWKRVGRAAIYKAALRFLEEGVFIRKPTPTKEESEVGPDDVPGRMGQGLGQDFGPNDIWTTAPRRRN